MSKPLSLGMLELPVSFLARLTRDTLRSEREAESDRLILPLIANPVSDLVVDMGMTYTSNIDGAGKGGGRGVSSQVDGQRSAVLTSTR